MAGRLQLTKTAITRMPAAKEITSVTLMRTGPYMTALRAMPGVKNTTETQLATGFMLNPFILSLLHLKMHG